MYILKSQAWGLQLDVSQSIMSPGLWYKVETIRTPTFSFPEASEAEVTSVQFVPLNNELWQGKAGSAPQPCDKGGAHYL